MTDNHLQKFCREVLSAVEGRVVPIWFNDGFALCTNAGRYDRDNDSFVYDTLYEIFDGEAYPFNNGSSADYRHERWHLEFYTNEKRIAFLRKHAKGA